MCRAQPPGTAVVVSLGRLVERRGQLADRSRWGPRWCRAERWWTAWSWSWSWLVVVVELVVVELEVVELDVELVVELAGNVETTVERTVTRRVGRTVIAHEGERDPSGDRRHDEDGRRDDAKGHPVGLGLVRGPVVLGRADRRAAPVARAPSDVVPRAGIAAGGSTASTSSAIDVSSPKPAAVRSSQVGSRVSMRGDSTVADVPGELASDVDIPVAVRECVPPAVGRRRDDRGV